MKQERVAPETNQDQMGGFERDRLTWKKPDLYYGCPEVVVKQQSLNYTHSLHPKHQQTQTPERLAANYNIKREKAEMGKQKKWRLIESICIYT